MILWNDAEGPYMVLSLFLLTSNPSNDEFVFQVWDWPTWPKYYYVKMVNNEIKNTLNIAFITSKLKLLFETYFLSVVANFYRVTKLFICSFSVCGM